MRLNTKTLERALLAFTVCLHFIRWSPDVLDHLRHYSLMVATRVQTQTLPGDARNSKIECSGFTPFAIGATWQFESDETWDAYQKQLNERLASDFEVDSTKANELHFYVCWPGHSEHLYVERLESHPLRIRCDYLQVNAAGAD
jgi:hypothetical protein